MKNRTHTTTALLALFLFLTIGIPGTAQQIYMTDRPMEHLQLLTDRDLYISGESVWFAVHRINPRSASGQSISSVVYAELSGRTIKSSQKENSALSEVQPMEFSPFQMNNPPVWFT